MAVLAQTGEATVQPLTYMTVAALPVVNTDSDMVLPSLPIMSLPSMPTTSSNGFAVIQPLPIISLAGLPTASSDGLNPVLSQLYIPVLAFINPYGSGIYTITGTVTNGASAPLSRTVVAVSRSDNIPRDVTLSDPITGAFTLRVPSLECYVVCFPSLADGTNAEIFDQITPVLP